MYIYSGKIPVELDINERKYLVLINTWDNLLKVLRDQIGLLGTKYGCGTGDCGACTVIVDGRAQNACLLLTVRMKGKKITTIEGLAKGENMHPIQQSLIEYGGVQCGYCSPGIIMSAKALLDENPSPTEHEIRTSISGNLCRCTGYQKIVEAIMAASVSMRAQQSDGKP